MSVDTFVLSIVLGLLNKGNISLSDIEEKCEELQYGLKISKQAIKDKLQVGGVLMKEIFKKALEYVVKESVTVESIKVLKQFSAVYICDATSISLPDKLDKIFKGLGGKNSKAALKIQVVYNVLTKCFKIIEITKAPGNDSAYTKTITEMAKENDLCIYDLGYFNTLEFKKLDAKGAYFISRVKTNTNFYIEHATKGGKLQKISILEILKKSNNGIVDTHVYVGRNKNKRMHTRLVAIILPEEIANERVRKA